MSVSYWDQVDFEVEITRPITLTLDDNELIFAQRNHWHLVKSDVQRAVEEIERLRQELDKSTKVNQELLQDIVEINQTKEVMLEIVSSLIKLIKMMNYFLDISYVRPVAVIFIHM